MGHQSEAKLEDNLIKTLSQNGYERVLIPDIDALEANFKIQLEKFNKVRLSTSEFKRVLTHLRGGSIFEKATKLRGQFELTLDDGENQYISFLNKEKPEANIFQVTNQITNKKGTYENRYDVTILINGLPLMQIELKRRGIEIKEAFNQVERYKKDSLNVSLFEYIQLFVISNGVNTKYFANNKTLSNQQLFYWSDEKNNIYSKLDDFAKHFLDTTHLVKMISRYIVLQQTDKILMVLRPYQYYAVEKIIEKVNSGMKVAPKCEVGDNSQNGYIFHTTGSGKTLTSFKAAQLLVENSDVDKILFVVDRKDLDYQTSKEFNHFSKGSVSTSESTRELVDNFTGGGVGSSKKNRNNKLIITTIQKLTNAIKPGSRHTKAMDEFRDKRIVFIFDECHRSQFGDMHNQIVNFFSNHQCFGFTGTPIFNKNSADGRTTKMLFGECLHTYQIKNAIDDNNVLGFSVEYMSTFKEKKDIKDQEVEAIDTEEVFLADKRVNMICDYIIENHDHKTDYKRYHSIFAVSSINALIKYYDCFKSKKHDLKIATIFSFGVNEDRRENGNEERNESSRDKLESYMKDYNKMFGTKYSTKSSNADDFNGYYVNVSKNVKERKVDVLLVVGMFLTGFDSKYLNTLYVDKNLQYHGLIQAFSRTNRILDERKMHGNIVCFNRPVKNKVIEAIELFSDDKSLETVLMKSYDEYLEQFDIIAKLFLKKYPDMESVDKLEGERAKLEFIQEFRALMRIKTILNTFAEFKFSDTMLGEQAFEDYSSKYKDLYNDTIDPKKVKVSILNDIDFEIELLEKQNINVDYILELINGLDTESDTIDKDIKFIIKQLSANRELKSKAELIEAFLKDLRNLEGDVMANFQAFEVVQAQEKLTNLAVSYNLDKEGLEEYIDFCRFSGLPDNEFLDKILPSGLGLSKRRVFKEDLKHQVEDYICTYDV